MSEGIGPQIQTNWVVDVVTSQFFWGIVFGLLLAVVVAAVSIWLDTRRRQRLVITLCKDLISSICDLIQNLEENRERNIIIEHEYLDTIAAEIVVYGRNREHLAVVPDPNLRSQIVKFFTRVAALLAHIQWRLRQYYDVNQLVQTVHEPQEKQDLKVIADLHLEEAHKACDRLREAGRDAPLAGS